jgi:hypothetical protein
VAQKWPGIVVRCNLNETGEVPRSSSTNSPDIVISGQAPFPDPAILTDPKNYNNAYDNKLFIGRPNYLYIRGKNFTGGELQGKWSLFFSTPNILLYPYLWQNNPLVTANGDNNPFAIKAGEIGASTNAFIWVPPEISGTYSMIGIADTPGYGNPLQGVTNITSLAETLATNANIAQRNVNVVRENVPQVIASAGYNQGSEGFKVSLVAIFQNIPGGSSCSVACGTPLNGRTLSYSTANTQDRDFRCSWADQQIPAYWNTLFTWALTFGPDWSGIPAGAKPKVTIRGEIVMDSTHRLYHLGQDADVDPETGKPQVDASGKPLRVLEAGALSTVYTGAGPDPER